MKKHDRGTVHVGVDATAMAAELVAHLARPLADAFDRPLVVTSGPAVDRWLSQAIATASPEGICAGVQFETVPRLEALLLGDEREGDPWAPQALVFRILDLVRARTPGLEPLERTVSQSDDSWLNALRVARLLHSYATHRPGMTDAWLAASDVEALGLGFDSWQPHLWRALHEVIGRPDPGQRVAALAWRLRSGKVRLPWPNVSVFLPGRLTRPRAELLAALAEQRPVTVWHLAPTGGVHPLATRLAGQARDTLQLLADAGFDVSQRQEARPGGSLLAAVQRDLADGVGPRAASEERPSITLLSSHGLQRQVEVLRDTVATLLNDDPSLEPRDVLILTPRPDELSPHLEAVFRSDDPRATDRHPGYGFRVQATPPGSADANLLYGMVRTVAEISTGRATVQQLQALIDHPLVARRFGWSLDERDRLAELASEAAVRWGIDGQHRQRFGLSTAQNTWQAGVQRLLLGAALGDESVATVRTVTPVDDVDSSTVTAIGGLAELVSRVGRFVRESETRRTPVQWAAVLRELVDGLTQVPFEDTWQQTQLWGVLAAWERHAGQTAQSVGLRDALAMLDDEFAGQPARPAWGNGAMIVASPSDAAGVPHRVVCLVGLDEASFPRRILADGDDLLAREPQPGEPDAGRADRQHLLDAVLSARDHLVIIHQGRSSHTNELYPVPSGVVDLVEVLATMTGRSHEPDQQPLQPFATANFAPPARSFDRSALLAARALQRPGRPAPTRYDTAWVPLQTPRDNLSLDDLTALLEHPAKYLLKQRARLTFWEKDEASNELPIELDGLDRWRIGDRLLDGLDTGHDLESLKRRERLMGDVPPGQLGTAVLDDVSARVETMHRLSTDLVSGDRAWHSVDHHIAGVRVTGRVTTRGGRVIARRFSRVGRRQRITAWVQALAAAVATDAPVASLLVGTDGTQQLQPVDPDAARTHLGVLVTVALVGLERVLPMPSGLAEYWAEQTSYQRQPDPKQLKRQWGYDRDAVWKLVGDARNPWEVPRGDDPWGFPQEPSEFGALARLVWLPIVKAGR